VIGEYVIVAKRDLHRPLGMIDQGCLRQRIHIRRQLEVISPMPVSIRISLI
jgi:hypothetical protein